MRSAREPHQYRGFLTGRRLVATAAVLVLLVAGGAAIFVLLPSPRQVAPAPTTSVQLAVLPLRMVGGSESAVGDQYLGIGIADSIITRLAGVRQIGLRPTAAVLRYADQPADPATVAKALAVGHVLVGTIQRNADTYRITLQLVQSGDSTVSWARSYDVLRSALTNLQDTIAEEVVNALRLQLTQAERDRVRRRYTDNAEAYDLYLRGRASFVNYTEIGMKTAIGDFLLFGDHTGSILLLLVTWLTCFGFVPSASTTKIRSVPVPDCNQSVYAIFLLSGDHLG
jgi:TolB-like protein